MRSLLDRGQEEAILVKERDGRLEIVDGIKRWMAARELARSGYERFLFVNVRFDPDSSAKRSLKIITSQGHFEAHEDRSQFLNEWRRFCEVSKDVIIDASKWR